MASFFEDVIRSDSRFNSVKRVADINLLEPVTRSAVSRIVEDAGAPGIDLMVFETYRSQARQQELFNQGASKLRVVGVHHFGLAVDLVKVVRALMEGRFFFPRAAGTRARPYLGRGLG